MSYLPPDKLLYFPSYNRIIQSKVHFNSSPHNLNNADTVPDTVLDYEIVVKKTDEIPFF